MDSIGAEQVSVGDWASSAGMSNAEDYISNVSGEAGEAATGQAIGNWATNLGMSNAESYISDSANLEVTEEVPVGSDWIPNAGLKNASSYLYDDSAYDGAGWGDDYI